MNQFQEIHDYLNQNGFDCEDGDEEKSARFPDQEMRHAGKIHNACVAAGAKCQTKAKSAKADVIRKGNAMKAAKQRIDDIIARDPEFEAYVKARERGVPDDLAYTIAKRGGDAMTSDEISKAREDVLKTILGRPIRAINGAIGHRALSPWYRS